MVRNRIHQINGSWPQPPQGLQLKIRFVAFQPPLNSPYFFKAASEY